MGLIILLVTFLFVSVSFISGNSTDTTNSFLSYVITELRFIFGNFIVITLGYVLGIVIFITLTKFDKNYAFSHKLRSAFFYITQVVVLGFFLSYISLFIIAILQLNVFSILSGVNPKIMGVENDTDKIINKLKTNNVAPKIVVNDSKTISAIAQATTGFDTFYGKIILPSIPNFLILSGPNDNPSLILIDKTLIITKINTDDLEKISPIIGHLFVKEYFGNKFVKAYPKVSVMDKKEYQLYRQKENLKKIIKINEHLKNLNNFISTISAAIENDKLQIEKSKELLGIKKEDQKSQYEKCVDNYEISYCKNLLSQLDKNELSKSRENKELEEWNKQLELDQSLLKVYEYYFNFYNTQKSSLVKFNNIIINEQGVFEPDNHIKIRLETTDAHAISDFLAILVHEYFHYASYSKERKFANTFFEESLTEYFTRQVTQHNLDIKTNLGYPIQSRLISKFSDRIAESELVNIYFTKDDKKFDAALDRVYGEGFYQKNQLIFEALQYTSDPKQLVNLANEIMLQIGGEKLSEKDFYSTTSNL